MIHAAAALSTQSSTSLAALEIAKQLLEQLGAYKADFCLVFCSDPHLAELDRMLDTLTHALDTPYITGASAAGVIAAGREVESGPAVAALAVASNQLRATPFLFADEGDHGLSAGIRLGQRLSQSRRTDDLVCVWPDAVTVRPDRLLQGLDAVLGAVPVIGAAASNQQPDVPAITFSGSESRSASVAGVRLGGEFSSKVLVTQGCRPLGPPLRVTGAHENLILELEGRPAASVVRELAPEGQNLEPDWALAHLFIGTQSEPGPTEFLARNLVALDFAAGGVGITERVPEGSYVVLALRDPDTARAEFEGSLARLRAESADFEPKFGLFFNCRARGEHFYGSSNVDSDLLSAAFPGLPILGFFGNAEMGPLRGQNHLFTYTGVFAVVGTPTRE